METEGEVVVSNLVTGEVARLVLRPCKGKLEQRGFMSGTVFTADGKPAFTMEVGGGLAACNSTLKWRF